MELLKYMVLIYILMKKKFQVIWKMECMFSL